MNTDNSRGREKNGETSRGPAPADSNGPGNPCSSSRCLRSSAVPFSSRVVKDTGLFYFPMPQPNRRARRSVCFIPADDAGCGWLRCLLPALGLSEVCDWHAAGAWGLRYSLDQIAGYDVVVFQRQGSGPALRNMLACKARGQTVVYEIDDYALSAPRVGHPAGLAVANATPREYVIECIRAADLVTVTTPALAATYRRFNHHIAVLPNCTHPDVNRRERLPRMNTNGHEQGNGDPVPLPEDACGPPGGSGSARSRNEPPGGADQPSGRGTNGVPKPPAGSVPDSRPLASFADGVPPSSGSCSFVSIRGSVSVVYAAALAHRDDAALLRAVIPAVVERRPEAQFLFFGDWPHRDWAPALPHTWRMEFLPLRLYYHTLALMDIGLAPLRLNEFTRHKSNLKALDYLGAGVAPVLQDHPVYAEFRRAIDCLKARNTKDWIHAITMLIDRPDLRAEIAANGRRVVDGYDYRRHAHRWAQAYEEAICRPSRKR